MHIIGFLCLFFVLFLGLETGKEKVWSESELSLHLSKQSRDFEAHIVRQVFLVILLLSFFLLGPSG